LRCNQARKIENYDRSGSRLLSKKGSILASVFRSIAFEGDLLSARPYRDQRCVAAESFGRVLLLLRMSNFEIQVKVREIGGQVAVIF